MRRKSDIWALSFVELIYASLALRKRDVLESGIILIVALWNGRHQWLNVVVNERDGEPNTSEEEPREHVAGAEYQQVPTPFKVHQGGEEIRKVAVFSFYVPVLYIALT